MATGSNIYEWKETMDDQCLILLAMLLKTFYIFFGPSNKEPPDKREKKSEDSGISIPSLRDMITHIIYFIKDSFYHFMNLNIDLHLWISIFSQVSKEYLINFVQTFLAIDFISRKEESESKWETSLTSSIPIFEVNCKDPYHFKQGKLITSNLVFLMSTKSNKNELDLAVQLDTDSYSIAIDTCTSETVVKHKEMFVGKISLCQNLFVQGVGGQLKASGYRTMISILLLEHLKSLKIQL
jgi:hypothetical protein